MGAALQEVNGEILLEDLHVEFEVRKSDFINVGLRGKAFLEATSIAVMFDKQSMYDLIVSNNLSVEAYVHVQLVSEDSRSVRQKKGFYLKDFEFESQISLNLF